MVTIRENKLRIVLAMLVALMLAVPMQMAWAAGDGPDGGGAVAQGSDSQGVDAAIWDGSIDTSWYNTSKTEFTLTKPAQLAGFAAIVNGDAEGIERDTFAGKTVKLGADITLNAASADDVDTTGTQRSWTPIGRLPMPSVNPDGSEGAMPHYTDGFFFDGIFDGQGHLIKNLYIYDNPAGSYGGVQGFFANVGGNATITNVGLEGGYVYGRVAAGLVAISHVTEGLDKVPHIIGCYTNVTVVCNGSSTRGAGGIFGGEEQYRDAFDEDGVRYEANYHGGAYIANCYNVGTITRAYTGACAIGGIAGTGSVQIYGCYNRGSVPVYSTYAGSLAGNLIGSGYLVGQNKAGHPWEGNSVVHDSYALSGTVPADERSLVKLYNLIDSKHGKDGTGSESPAVTDADDVKFQLGAWFATADNALSQSFDNDSASGFPVLYWQHGASAWNFNEQTYYGGWTYRIEDIEPQAYTGNPLTPALDIWYPEDESDYTSPEIDLHEGSDYTVTYSKNTNIGQADVAVAGIGRFYNGRTVHFDIIDGDLNNVYIEPIPAQWYYGELGGVTPELVIWSGTQKLSKDDIDIAWSNNGAGGAITWDETSRAKGVRTATASVTITPKEQATFTGSKTATFTVLEASTSLASDENDANTKLISSKADLQFLAYKTHTGNDIKEYSAYNYKVTNDIDATSIEDDDDYLNDRPCDPLFTSWGVETDGNKQFIHGLSGTFDGQYHTITLGQTEDGVSFDLHPALAFMIYTKSGANPTIENLTIDGSVSCPHGAAAGFLVMAQSGNVTFENCTNAAAINGDQFYGGGAGGFIVETSMTNTMNLTMTDCINKGSVSSAASRAGGFISALGGMGVNTFTNCTNTGTITGGQETGSAGLVAVQLGDNSNIGVTGDYAKTTFSACSNLGNVTVGNSDCGGILGWNQDPVKTITLDRCYNRGNITGGGVSTTVGGLVGRSYSPLTIVNSYNTGDVAMLSSNGTCPGGLVGYFGNNGFDELANADTQLYLTNSYSAGDIRGSSSGNGGLVGNIWLHTTIVLTNAYYDGSVSSKWVGYNPADKWSPVDPPEISGEAVAMDTSAMKTPAFVSMLGVAFGRDNIDTPVNKGFPIILATDREEIDLSDTDKADVTLNPTTWVYTGAPIKPAVTVNTAKGLLTEGVDFIVFYTTEGTNGRAIVQGIGYYKGSQEKSFTITPCNLDTCSISNTSSMSYSDVAGGAGEQDITVTNPAGGVMKEGTDYSVVYTQNDQAGTAYLRIEGKGPLYTGNTMRMFTIEKGDLSDENQVSVTEVDEHYPLAKGTGGLYIYEQLVARSGYVLERADEADTSKDYARQFYYVNADGTTGDIVTTANGQAAAYSISKAGTYRARFIGSAKRNTGLSTIKWTNENWDNYAEATFTYGNRMAEDAEVSGISEIYPYTGSKITIEPSLMNKITEYPMEKGTDYTITITDKNGNDVTDNLVDTGKYTLTINSAGNDWFGEKKFEFEVVPSEYFIDDSTVVEGIQDTYLSTGSAIAPVPTAVKIGSHALGSSDYTVSYQNAKGADIDAPSKSGTYFAVITGRGDYTGVKRVPFTIEDPIMSVYVKTGKNGKATLARAFSRDEFVALKSGGDPVSALYCGTDGRDWKVATAKEYVTLDGLISAAGVTGWGSGATVSYGGDDSSGKSSTSYSYDELQELMFYPGTTSSATDTTGGTKAPFVFSITDCSVSIGSSGTTTAYDAQEYNVRNARSENMPRAIMGVSSSNYVNARTQSSAKTMGVRLWSKTSEVVVTLPEPEPKPNPTPNPNPNPTPDPTPNPTPDPTPTPSPTPNPNNGGQNNSGKSDNPEPAEQVEKLNVYRLYNPNSSEHFYTLESDERDYLASLGWNYEGIAWTAPSSSKTPVFRMYNPAGSEHHYTTDASERDFLASIGWNYEGVSWYSDDNLSVPLFRLYNPNAFANNHHYTADAAERDWLFSLGWVNEGIAWYGI